MSIDDLILRVAEKRGAVKTSDIVGRTRLSRAYINRFLHRLVAGGKLALVGKANRARYVLPSGRSTASAAEEARRTHRMLRNLNLSEHSVLAEIRRSSGIFDRLRKNVSGIFDYAFLEMLNNAIEHSQSETVDVLVTRAVGTISFVVADRGVGIFDHVMQKRGLVNRLEAIQDLLKGKQTTAPESHSGEGIFFTSKLADALTIESADKKLVFDNILQDVRVADKKNLRGTRVRFSLSEESARETGSIFREYTDENYEFGRTLVVVKLYRSGKEHLSRSQARRITSGLDKFKTVVLNFSGVETIGQAFADEIFRVWKACHPKIEIVPRNADANVAFMIRRVQAGT